ncbi:MAG: Gar1/Naf1 family protein [Candidatus Bathyarchaeota archaeon]|nr:Gar1/Naf1 family protein [Candidatus Termiticorpusculum sp.]
MQRIGKVLNITPSNNIIIKTENPPKIGCEIADENLTTVGKIFDIIGPVSSSYAVIKPTIKNPTDLLNKTLYLLPSKQRSKKYDY